ncbi:hypothetical protein BG74_04125 [Sodalis-like endosymbiont of Proechinophthirus fluctus]|nr:hypothetical protein BG74_04125 [Sodalis-like endosymbiont of Proechinophthirus fluctus]
MAQTVFAIVYLLTYPSGTVVGSYHSSPTSFIAMTLLFKVLLRALVVVLIESLSKTRTTILPSCCLFFPYLRFQPIILSVPNAAEKGCA